MRVLVLGGTVFLGRHLVETLLARGADVTLFHRGKHGVELFPGVRRILGDRERDLDALPRGERWDAVVDTCGYLSRHVAASAAALRERADRYVFISSVSVYDASRAPLDESSPIVPLPEGAPADAFRMEHYGPLKALCERAAREAFGAGRTLLVRPGLIAGPWDPTDRFTYWPLRFARGGDVLVPDDLDAPAQYVDVRDVAAFVVESVARETSGAVNAVGPAEPLTLRGFFAACEATARAGARIVPVDPAFLAAREVQPWTDLPLWVPDGTGYDGIARVDPSRAIALGYRHRPLAETLADTLTWAREHRDPEALQAGLAPGREAELLAGATAALARGSA